jgi:hypothetical protein
LGPNCTGKTNGFNGLAVEYTLESLGRLRAHELWLDHGDAAPARYGITEKSLTIELELRGEPGKTLKVTLEKSPVSDWPFAATVLEGHTYVFAFPAGTYVQLLHSLDPAP